MTEPVAQATPHSHPYRIDTHHHILPPTYLAEERERILRTVRTDESVLEWSPERSLDEMDRNGIATAVTSISHPGVYGLAITHAVGALREPATSTARVWPVIIPIDSACSRQSRCRISREA
jgi:hypothetical protein